MVPLSLNWTLPVGVLVPTFALTVAVKVTASPKVEGFLEEVIPVVVGMATWTTVGLDAPATAGSSVRTLAKLLPDTVPWLLTLATVIELLSVTWKVMFRLFPAGSRSIPMVIVPPVVLTLAAGGVYVGVFEAAAGAVGAVGVGGVEVVGLLGATGCAHGLPAGLVFWIGAETPSLAVALAPPLRFDR